MPSPSLPIGDCLLQAARYALLRPVGVLRAFWPVYLLAPFMHLLQSPWWQMLAALAASLATVPCACAWHSHMIVGEEPRLRLGEREWRFFVTQLGIFVVALVVLFTAGVLGALSSLVHWSAGIVIGTIGLVLLSWLIAPMLLGLPAAAIGARRNSNELEAMAAPSRMRLTVLTMAIPLAQSLLNLAVPMLGDGAPMLKLALDVVCWPLGVGILSIAYMWLSNPSQEAVAQ